MAERLEWFLRGLHRRLLVLRAVEGAGLGVLGGCALCLAVVPVLIDRAEAVWGAVGMMLGLGAALGLVWTVLRPPRLMEAAGMADAQLGLADLLTSAWMVRGREDEMSRAVLAMAAGRVATLSVNEVLLNRLGKRTWGGIGLAAALVVSMGLLSANPIETAAASETRSKAAASADAQKEDRAGQLARHVARMPGGVMADHPNERNNALDPNPNTEMGPDGKAADNNAGSAVANPDGAGGGAGRSKPKEATTDTLRPTATNDVVDPANRGGDATASGARAGTGAGNEGATGRNVGRTNGASAAPPWRTSNWGQSREAAESALREGAIPAEYHDLIRAYFDRK